MEEKEPRGGLEPGIGGNFDSEKMDDTTEQRGGVGRDSVNGCPGSFNMTGETEGVSAKSKEVTLGTESLNRDSEISVVPKDGLEVVTESIN